MLGQPLIEVTVLKDLTAVLIPDGSEIAVQKGQLVYIQQVLGGMFTVQSDEGRLLRIDGKDAESIGQPVPKECRQYTINDIEKIGIENIVKEELKACYDPEIPVNILDLGLVYQIEIKKDLIDNEQNIVRIEMTLTAPGCGMGEVLKSDVERKLRAVPTIKYVLVDLVFDPAWDSSMMSESAKLALGFL